MINLTPFENWQFKQHDLNTTVAGEVKADTEWLPAQVPGTVHTDLLAAKRIPDPFYGLNEQEVQWIGEQDWLYRATFDKPANVSPNETVTLCFDGLDTFASVWLNDKLILTSDNMFVPQRVNVTELLQPTDNRLAILFESALRRGKEREAQYGQLKAWNGDTSRMYVRKAQYHYGWDWGPCLLTAGVWQPMRLEVWQARISDVACPVELTADLSQATIKVQTQIETAVTSLDLAVRLQLFSPANELVTEAKVPVANTGFAENSLNIEQPELWWPNGYGAQPRYRLVVSLLDSNGNELDKLEKQLGVRHLQLVQEPISGESGKSFLFEVNNMPIFCGGANWIPADNFTTRVSSEKYRNWLQLAVDANMVMLRVWGGGIYEYDIFYDLCDEMGLLVWQDFMFACGIYPANDWFQESVRAEAEAVVRRLRHHACLALWSGNNEDYMIAHALKIYNPEESRAESLKVFPARVIYEELLPAVCTQLDPTRSYWPSSPYGGSDPNDQTQGDRHTWDVWHGAMADYHDYYRFEGRFVSEFGMAALPQLSTIETFAPPAERYPNSRTLEFHNKAGDGTRRISVYLADNLHQPTNLTDYIYATQFVQAEALTMAIRSWRRRWSGPNKYAVAGALVWQINDCWPVTSWAIADYDLNPKPAYYAVRRVLAPLTVEMLDLHNGEAALWCVNSGTQNIKADIELKYWTLDGATKQTKSYEVSLEANRATEVSTIPFKATEQLVVSAKLIKEGQVLARAALWPEPFKYLHLPDPAIKVTQSSDNQVQVQSQKPAKGVVLAAQGVTSWSDNFLDLLPDDPQTITFKGNSTPEISVSVVSQLERS